MSHLLSVGYDILDGSSMDTIPYGTGLEAYHVSTFTCVQ